MEEVTEKLKEVAVEKKKPETKKKKEEEELAALEKEEAEKEDLRRATSRRPEDAAACSRPATASCLWQQRASILLGCRVEGGSWACSPSTRSFQRAVTTLQLAA